MNKFGEWTAQADIYVAGLLKSHGIPMRRRRKGLNLESDKGYTPYFQAHAQVAFPSSWSDNGVLPSTNKKINGFTIEDRTMTREGGILDLVVGRNIPCFFIKVTATHKSITCIDGAYAVERYLAGHLVEMYTMVNRDKKEFFTVIELEKMVTGPENVVRFIKNYLKGVKPLKAEVDNALKVLKDHFDSLRAH